MDIYIRHRYASHGPDQDTDDIGCGPRVPGEPPTRADYATPFAIPGRLRFGGRRPVSAHAIAVAAQLIAESDDNDGVMVAKTILATVRVSARFVHPMTTRATVWSLSSKNQPNHFVAHTARSRSGFVFFLCRSIKQSPGTSTHDTASTKARSSIIWTPNSWCGISPVHCYTIRIMGVTILHRPRSGTTMKSTPTILPVSNHPHLL